MKISICIPSYNRPEELGRLLSSIDINSDVEILICEDNSPKRSEIRLTVKEFEASSRYSLVYIENEQNLGYDRNIKNLVKRSTGDFIVFMGDDDVFIPGALSKLNEFLEDNSELGYVLKSHQFNFADGRVEKFRYFDGTKFFEAGVDTYISLFRRSVFISGFIINRSYVEELLIDDFDGGLLYQLYMLAETAINYPCAYFDQPLTEAYEGGVPYFGSSETEKNIYTPGTITINNSLNFLSGFFDITKFIDNKYDIDSTSKIKHDMSKYFYPNLAIQREKGRSVFYQYYKELNRMGFNTSIYYYIYALALYVFGKKTCDSVVIGLKSLLGKTPQL